MISLQRPIIINLSWNMEVNFRSNGPDVIPPADIPLLQWRCSDIASFIRLLTQQRIRLSIDGGRIFCSILDDTRFDIVKHYAIFYDINTIITRFWIPQRLSVKCKPIRRPRHILPKRPLNTILNDVVKHDGVNLLLVVLTESREIDE